MNNKLSDKEWDIFKTGEVFDRIENCKTYHKKDVSESQNNGIPYISRTTQNNGLESIVKGNHFSINAKDTIVFGAESAVFFYQPYNYITGNKMYAIYDENINKYSGLFIKKMLDQSIKNCGFGYGKGLTGNRFKKRFILLPINKDNKPDYKFMEKYMKEKEKKPIKKYKNHILKRIDKLKKYSEVKSLSQKKWSEFHIGDIFSIKSGKRLTKADMKTGKRPFVSATSSNNGIREFVSNTNKSLDSNVLGVNYNGSVVESFYHPYKCLFSDDVKRLSFKDIEGSKHTYLFVKTVILKQKEKYQYGYKFKSKRMRRQKIMIPINENNNPDYRYMENYMKKIEYNKLKKYFDYLEN